LTTIVDLCAKTEHWEILNQTILLLSKKKSQSKISISKMLQRAMQFTQNIQLTKIKISLIETLRKVSEGKVNLN
jgi:26S proteasome regulatory subunit N5